MNIRLADRILLVSLIIGVLSACMSLADVEGLEALRPGEITGNPTTTAGDRSDPDKDGGSTETSSRVTDAPSEAAAELITMAPQASRINALPSGWDSLQAQRAQPVSFTPPLWQEVAVATGGPNNTFVVVFNNHRTGASRDLDQDVDFVGTRNGSHDVDMDADGRPELTAYRQESDADNPSHFIARLRSDGTAAWARRLDGFQTTHLSFGAFNNLLAVAYVPGLERHDWERGAADVDGDGIVDLENGQFLLSVGHDGEFSISPDYSILERSWISGSFVQPDGSMTIAGTLRSPVDLDRDGVLDTPGPGPDDSRVDIFVARYDSQGELVWANSFPSGLRTSVSQIAATTDGSFYLIGDYAGDGHGGPDFNLDGRSDFPPATITLDGGLLVPAGPPPAVPARAQGQTPEFGDPHILIEGRGRVETPDTGVITAISPSGDILSVVTVRANKAIANAVLPVGDDLLVVGTYGLAADLDNDGAFESLPGESLGSADFKSGPYTLFMLRVTAP